MVTSDTLAISALGDTLVLTALVTGRKGQPLPNPAVTWESSIPAVATVDSAGCVVSQGNGLTMIRVGVGRVSQMVPVRVQQLAAMLDVSVLNRTLMVSETFPLSGVVRDSNGVAVTGTPITWSSTDTQVAHIDPTGLVRGRYAGEAAIEGRAAGMSGSVTVTVRPRPLMSWVRERYAGNPVIQAVLDNPAESLSQYVPAPIRLPNGDIWVYVKGDYTHAIWAYKSTDGGRSYVVQGKAIDRGGPAAWDAASVLDPAAVYDQGTNTIHLWYKGTDDARSQTNWSWGHATASGDYPLTFTKDATNPILTPRDIETALGETDVTDNDVSNVIRIGGDFYFYGTFSSSDGYKIFYAKGSDWNKPVPQAVILTPGPGYEIVQSPTVFQHPDTLLYVMLFTEGFLIPPGERHLVAAQSRDGVVWERLPGIFLASSDKPNARGDYPWESVRVYGASMLKDSRGDFATPASVDGRYLLYYSGSSDAYGDETGLLVVTPAVPGY